MSEIEKHSSSKEAFLKELANIRTDVYPEDWSEAKKAKAMALVPPNKLRTALYSSIPMICRAEKCPYAEICELQKQDLAPRGSSCPYELSYVKQFMDEYIRQLGVDPEDLIEISMVRDLVDQEIQQHRTTWLLSMEHWIQDNVVGFSHDGEPVTAKQLHLAVEFQDRLFKRKKDLRNQLLATREARAKVGQGDINSSVAIAKIMTQIRKIDDTKQKELRKRLGYDDSIDEYIQDAEIVEEEGQ